MELQNTTIIIMACASCGLFAIGTALMSFITFKVATWLTEAEYDQWMDEDIARREGRPKVDGKKPEEKIADIDELKEKINEDLGIETTNKKDVKAKAKAKKKEEKDPDSEPKTAEEKHFSDVEAILNLPTY